MNVKFRIFIHRNSVQYAAHKHLMFYKKNGISWMEEAEWRKITLLFDNVVLWHLAARLDI
jgi:hypothetical protein